MNDKFHKMLAKKRDLSPVEKHAKHSVLHDLKGMASEALGDKLDGLKKVSVMSNSPEGLQHGLHKAGQIVSGSQEHGLLDDAENPGSDVGAGSMGGGPVSGMSEGGEVLSPDQGDYHAAEEGSPAEEGQDSSEQDENSSEEASEMDHEHAEDMDLDAIKAKIAHLMELQKRRESEDQDE